MSGAEGNETKAGERPRETPGRRLRRARERRELSVDTVASALHLNRGVVESLENDDYEKLPPITFVKGYLRVYARYLSLPESEVLGAFDRLGVREEMRPLGRQSGNRMGREAAARRSSPLPWLAMLLAALVLAAAGYLWHREGSMATLANLWSATEPVASEPGPPDDAPAAVDDKAPVADAKESDAETVSEPAAAESATVAAPPASDSTAAASPEASPATKQTSQSTPATAADASETATAPVADGSASPAAAVTDGESEEIPAEANAVDDANQVAPPGAAEDDLDTLAFRFQGESWMEVRDARGERLLFGLVSEPGSRELTGLPPFEIVVGSVDQVSLRHNGDVVDLSARARGQVARFTLGVKDSDG